MTIISDDLEQLRFEILQLKAERSAWEKAVYADVRPITKGMAVYPGFPIEVTPDLRESVLEGIDDLIGYRQHDIVRVSKPEGSA